MEESLRNGKCDLDWIVILIETGLIILCNCILLHIPHE